MNRFHACVGAFIWLVSAGAAVAAADDPDGLYAEVATTRGLIILRLEFEKAPMTCANFVGLAEGTIANAAFPPGVPFFDGTVWHRVVPGHVIQCGIPKEGKSEGPGYAFPNEIVAGLGHGRAGMVNMANGGPHTNGSQWCITLGDRSYLDGDYTVFGEVLRGMDVVFSIIQGDIVKSVKIVRVGQAALRFRPTSESFREMVDEAWSRVRNAEARKKNDEEGIISRSWPRAMEAGRGVRFLILKEGQGAVPENGSRVRVAYSGKTLHGKTFISTGDGGKPCSGDRPEPFDAVVGRPLVNPALDETIGRMKKGERRLVIVPADQAYGKSGFYAPERKGEKRFVISPDTVLVYEVTLLEILPPGSLPPAATRSLP